MTWVATGTATLTAAEIAAATAAAEAAAIAAAQAAATQAAAATATQAAAATAAEAALAPALTEVAATTLPEVAGSVLPEAATGILEAAPGVVPPPATPLPPAGLENVGQAAVPPPPAGVTPTPPAGIEQVGQPSIQTASGPATSDVASYQADKQLLEAARNFTPGPEQQLSNAELYASGNYTGPQTWADMAPGSAEGALESADMPELLNSVTSETNPFLQGVKDVGSWMNANKGYTAAGAYLGLQQLGAFDQKGGEMPQKRTFNNPYRLSPNFKGGPYSEPNVYKPRYAAQGGIMQSYQAGGPVERMSMMNTAMNPQGGLYPQGMIDKTQYASPTQRPVSAEMVEEAPAYERSNPMLMAEGGEVKGYAAGGKTMLPQFQGLFDAQPTQQNFVNPRGTMSPEMQAYYAQDFANQAIKSQMAPSTILPMTLPFMGTPATGGPGAPPSNMLNQPTGQSTFPGAASMQGGFGQGAQGYPSFAMGSGGSGGGGSGGPFPLQGQYGIVKMAPGGLARFANEGEVEERPARRYRGDLMGTLDKYNEMIEGRKSGSLPTGRADPYTGVVGTFEDSDVDTRLQNADVAAMTRLKKAGKRANVGIAAIPMGVQAGALNLPTNAAGGGIMQANLGSYAAGGNPRLLRGPGDGMSDNIPATIGGKQPARLADGEFVVPADVVSHLGNGSTDAGAKKLHAMMDKVRMDRTGKKKQAPAVKAKKYIPK